MKRPKRLNGRHQRITGGGRASCPALYGVHFLKRYEEAKKRSRQGQELAPANKVVSAAETYLLGGAK